MVGNRRTITGMFIGLFGSMAGAFIVPRGFAELACSGCRLTGFFSGVFGLLRRTSLRCFRRCCARPARVFAYNIGRTRRRSCLGCFGWLAPVGDFRFGAPGDEPARPRGGWYVRWLP